MSLFNARKGLSASDLTRQVQTKTIYYASQIQQVLVDSGAQTVGGFKVSSTQSHSISHSIAQGLHISTQDEVNFVLQSNGLVEPSIEEVQSEPILNEDISSQKYLGPAVSTIVNTVFTASTINTSTLFTAKLTTVTKSKLVTPSTITVAPSTITVTPSTITVAPSTITIIPSTITVTPSTITVTPSTITVAPSTITIIPSTITVLSGVTILNTTQLSTII